MDPATITVIVSAIVAGIVGGWKGKDVREQRRSDTPLSEATWTLRVDTLESTLREDHATMRAKIETLHEDVHTIKTDVAVVKTEINYLKDRA